MNIDAEVNKIVSAATDVERERAAQIVEAMIDEAPHKDHVLVRMALAIAARAIRRGRHLTESEKLANLATAMEDADAENGTTDNAEMAARIRAIASADLQ